MKSFLPRQIVLPLFAFAVLGLLASSARANGLIDSSVTGSLTFNGGTINYFDPGNGFVPSSGYLDTASPTVTITSPDIEFGFNDSINHIQANFTSATLTLEETFQQTGSNTASPFTATFTDAAFTGMAFTQVQENYPGALDYSLSGDTLTVNFAGGPEVPRDDFTAVFVTTTPEPGTYALLLAGVGLLGFCVRRQVGFAS